MAIISDDPENFKGINSEKIAIYRRAKNAAFSKFRDYTSSNKIRWSLFAYPNKKWAKKVYPDLSAAEAMKKLWQAIIDTARLSADDPVKAWEEHQNTLQSRCDKLNGAKIKKLYYKNSIGTDFSIGLPENYLFCGGAEAGVFDGVKFAANIPTEEVFSSPDRTSANGKLSASMPLCRNGQIIENFWFEFKDGKIVDYGAEKGLRQSEEYNRNRRGVSLSRRNCPCRLQFSGKKTKYAFLRDAFRRKRELPFCDRRFLSELRNRRRGYG